MLTLRHSPSSPFVRKIRIGAGVLGLDGEIRIEPADTVNPSDSVRQQNPLGKIPALVLEDGTVLFASRVSGGARHREDDRGQDKAATHPADRMPGRLVPRAPSLHGPGDVPDLA